MEGGEGGRAISVFRERVGRSLKRGDWSRPLEGKELLKGIKKGTEAALKKSVSRNTNSNGKAHELDSV